MLPFLSNVSLYAAMTMAGASMGVESSIKSKKQSLI
jgi:hypothetical protein